MSVLDLRTEHGERGSYVETYEKYGRQWMLAFN
jgi:hypothetical protein